MQATLFEASMTGSICAHTHAQKVLGASEDVLYFPHFYASAESERFFHAFIETVPWHQDTISFYGKNHPMPRLTAWYGDPDAVYTYSKVRNEPMRWSKELLEILADLYDFTGVRFNSVLLNRYRNGADSLSWHADDEPELGDTPVIASLSFGATRTFSMRRNDEKNTVRSIDLEDGSLTLMMGATQRLWRHSVPKTRRPVGERVNLTFRVIGADRSAI